MGLEGLKFDGFEGWMGLLCGLEERLCFVLRLGWGRRGFCRKKSNVLERGEFWRIYVSVELEVSVPQ